MRVECNYKIGIERKVREKLSEKVQLPISSVTFYASMKHYRAVVGLLMQTMLSTLIESSVRWITWGLSRVRY